MPNPQIVSLTAPSLPPGYCFSTWQQLAIDLFTGAFGTISASVGLGFNYGAAIPAVNDQSKPWVRLNAQGAIIGTYTYAFGRWVMTYPAPPGPSDLRQIWVGTLPDLYSYDGGDGIDPTVTPPTNVTGSFWEQDVTFAARTILGVGTLPISGTVLSVGDLGGLEKVGLITSEMPPHTHTPVSEDQPGKPPSRLWGTSGDGSKVGAIYGGDHGLAVPPGTGEVPINTTLTNTGGDTSVTPIVVKPHENMPPFYAAFIIKRTARIYYAV